MKKLLVVAALLMPFGASVAAPVSAVPGAPTNYRYFDRLPSASGSIRPPGTDESIPLGSSGCGNRTVSWAVGGNTCTGSTGTTSGNTVKAVTSTNANSGIGNFRCDATTFDYTYQATGSTCAPPPPANCTAQTLSWTIGGNTCSGAAGTTANASTVSVASTSANTGTGSFTCNSATNTYTNNAASSTCNPVPPSSCTDKPLSWTVGGVTCGAQSGVTANATNKTISSTNGQNGSATFTCNSATDAYTQGAGATCAAPACTAQSLSWTAGGLTCTGTSAATSNTSTAVVNNSTAGRTGSATFTCNGATNAYTGPAPGASCATAATACTDKVVSWTQGSNTCSAQSGTTSNGTTKTVTTTTASRLGSASITCNASTDTYTVAAGGTCYPTTCTSQSINWTSGSNTCSGTTGAVNNGSSASVTSTNANTGSVTATCNSQTNTYAQSGATCGAPPVNCAAQSVTWAVSGNTCSGTASATTHNNTVAVSSANGSATYTCSNGTFTGPAAGATCTAPPPVNCSAETLSWTVGANTCSASSGARNTGTTFSLTSSNGLSGSASFSCTNGTYSAPSGASCTNPLASFAVDTFFISAQNGAFASGNSARLTGLNFFGSIGNGRMPSKMSPRTISAPVQFRETTSNGLFSCGIAESNNEVFCSGSFSSIFENVPAPTDSFVSVGIFAKKIHSTNGGLCYIDMNDTLLCKGYIAAGKGTGEKNADGTAAQPTTWTTPTGLVGNVRDMAIATGVGPLGVAPLHACVVLKDNTAKCWGYNVYGQLGVATNNNTDYLAPVAVSGLTDVKKIEVSTYNTCAVLNSGSLKCWGRNSEQQVGDMGTKNCNGCNCNCMIPEYTVPQQVTNMTSGVVDVALGFSSACALKSNGSVFCWGSVGGGMLGNGEDGVGQTYPREAGTPEAVPGLSSGVTALFGHQFSGSVGNHICVIQSGALKCWGIGGTDQTFLAKSIGDGTGAAITSTPKTIIASGVTKYLSESGLNTCVRLSSGDMSCWGDNSFGGLGDNDAIFPSGNISATPEPISNFYTGCVYTGVFARSTTGSVLATGRNTLGELGIGNKQHAASLTKLPISNVKKVSPQQTNTVFLTEAGAVLYSGTINPLANVTTPTSIAGLESGVTDIANNGSNFCALQNGGVKCVGNGARGINGNGATTASATPVQVTGLTSGVSVLSKAAGTATYTHCAGLSAGGVRCWGHGTVGQLGNGAVADATSPVVVSGISEVVRSITVRGDGSVSALGNSGRVYAWGLNSAGQLGDGTSTNRSAPVTPIGMESGVIQNEGMCNLKSDGSVWCSGFIIVGDGVSDGSTSAKTALTPKRVPGIPAMSRLSSAPNVMCGVTADNVETWCWGDNRFGSFGTGAQGISLSPVRVR